MSRQDEVDKIAKLVSPLLGDFGNRVYDYDTPDIDTGLPNLHKHHCNKLAEYLVDNDIRSKGGFEIGIVPESHENYEYGYIRPIKYKEGEE